MTFNTFSLTQWLPDLAENSIASAEDIQAAYDAEVEAGDSGEEDSAGQGKPPPHTSSTYTQRTGVAHLVHAWYPQGHAHDVSFYIMMCDLSI